MNRACARCAAGRKTAFITLGFLAAWLTTTWPGSPADQSEAGPGSVPSSGGTLVVSVRAEPQTFNPVVALDAPSREIIQRLHADLVRIDRTSSKTFADLAESFQVAPDGRRITLRLREGLRFSDGHPATVDDVLFSFQVYQDTRVGAVQRDLLVKDGESIGVTSPDRRHIVFAFRTPFAPAERLFDSVPILPKHLLETAYRTGTLSQVWKPGGGGPLLAGLGPFRMKEYVPGVRTVLERNPYYWRRDEDGRPLPRLDRLVFLVSANEDAQVLRVRAGDADLVGRVSPVTAAALGTQSAARLIDAGPSLEHNFLLFNLNEIPAGVGAESAQRRRWLASLPLRQAISRAIDRSSIARLVYRGRATPIAVPLSPANRPWFNSSVVTPTPSPAAARRLLQAARFSWDSGGRLLDAQQQRVTFTILVASGNTPRVEMASIVEEDLRALGIAATVVPLEFRSLVDRVTRTLDFETALMGLASGDVDPSAEASVWSTGGQTHLWRLDRRAPPLPWEIEIDSLMREQASSMDRSARKRAFDRVQYIAAEQLPMIPLVSPHLLVVARDDIGGLAPSALDPSVVWNGEWLFWRGGPPPERR